jgi:hypothetical protein
MRRPHAAVLFLALASCHDDDCHDCDGGDPIPVFFEAEPNDVPAQATSFGVLLPGDHFFIDGSVRDDLTDPFDGLAFTSGSALHVDFLLHSQRASADMDVCLYDPFLDQTLACFATDVDPEVGGVDVTGPGFDFHLVVESFLGDASYSLEILVQPLFAATAAEDSDPERSPSRLRATSTDPLRTPRAESGYRDARTPGRPVLRLEERLWIDVSSGQVFGFSRVQS